MKNYLCVYLPMLSINLIEKKLVTTKGKKLERDKAILLIHNSAKESIIKRCCYHALSLNIHEGDSLSIAKALAPNSYIVNFNPHRDLHTLKKLALYLTKYSPLVGVDNDLLKAAKTKFLMEIPKGFSGITVDLTGTQRIHKDFSHLLFSIANFLKCNHFESRLAIGPTIGAAWALSRFGREPILICDDKSLREHFNYLPIEALRISQTTIELLNELGIYSISDLLLLPKKKLAERFGLEILTRLDQVMGGVPETIKAIKIKKTFSIFQDLPQPLIDNHQVSLAISHLLSNLFLQLAKEGLKSANFIIILKTIQLSGQRDIFTKEISFLSPSNNQNLIAIISPVIESIHFKGAVENITIKSINNQKASSFQRSLNNDAQQASHSNDILELLTNLSIKLGNNAIRQLEERDHFLPEKAFCFRPLQLKNKNTKHYKHTNAALSFNRPPFLFDAPQPITVIAELPDQPPVAIWWKNKQLKIFQSLGPERILDQWWLQNVEGPRDYFRIQDELGRWLWIFKSPSLNWFVHGIWI